LAPLRFGAGLKGKLIDAALCGLPAITTSIGAEGLYESQALTGKLDTCFSINEFEEFAMQAIELYNDETSWTQLQSNMTDWISTRFSEQQYSDSLIQSLHHIIENLDQHRLNNFTGSMMRHHSMKSSQYMAQWIEAKNKNP
jgi:hypothetical protein